MGIDEAVNAKREEILRITAKYGAHNVRIFGSRVRGDARPDSDVDFLLEMPPGCSLLDLGRLTMDLQDLLSYQSGRVEPIPRHYEFIGVVEHFWEKAGAVGVRIKTSVLRQGDRIAFELPVEFEEQDVESLEVDKHPVSQVESGMLVAIKTSLDKGRLKKGARVFRLIQS